MLGFYGKLHGLINRANNGRCRCSQPNGAGLRHQVNQGSNLLAIKLIATTNNILLGANKAKISEISVKY